MATERQITANRASAANSTGPRTPAGKAASRRNSLSHGLSAQKLLLDGEDPAAFEALRSDLFREFAPVGMLEARLIELMASLLWRLLRVPAFEAAILEWVAFRQVELFDSKHSVNANPSKDIRRYGNHLGLRNEDHLLSAVTNQRLKLGRMLEAALEKDLAGKLGRHEAHLMRQLRQTQQQFFELKTARPILELDAEPEAIIDQSTDVEATPFIEVLGSVVNETFVHDPKEEPAVEVCASENVAASSHDAKSSLDQELENRASAATTSVAKPRQEPKQKVVNASVSDEDRKEAIATSLSRNPYAWSTSMSRNGSDAD
jgi:hypothetical protein